MKTKIIYISGNELFDMADVRSAFEEVRMALALGPDTILFGVPVDSDDALGTQKSNNLDTNIDVHEANTVAEPETNTVEPVPEPEKKPTTRRTRKSSKIVPISEAITANDVDVAKVKEDAADEPAPVVPILSVLESKSDTNTNNEEIIESVDINTTTTNVVAHDENVSDLIDDVPTDTTNDTPETYDTESVTINDMIVDDAPTTDHEKTLEELLESMTPLGEDAEKQEYSTPTNDDEENNSPESKTTNDIDITLEKLATEFVENQDKINTQPKQSARGKIGKLKNILPFKKAKNDDSGLMGDLFGWAGAAANDEDFTIPGFFK